MEFKWENIEDDFTADNLSHSTYRAKVIGGWVLRLEMLIDSEREQELEGYTNAHNSLVFIPDPDHMWLISDKVES